MRAFFLPKSQIIISRISNNYLSLEESEASGKAKWMRKGFTSCNTVQISTLFTPKNENVLMP